jgi:hypothetical protein
MKVLYLGLTRGNTAAYVRVKTHSLAMFRVLARRDTIDEPPAYAASCRWVTKGTRARLEAWSHTMTIGQPLPTLHLWLAEALVIPLDLEQSYEQACHDL